MPDQRPDAVVVGAGIAGLVAARDLMAAGLSVLVLEGSAEPGGKLRLGSVAGVAVDVGAESMLARRPEGVGLLAELGVEPVHPASSSSHLWTRDELRPLPRTLLGVPLDLEALAVSGVLSDDGLARARHETRLPVDEEDVSVAELLGSRLGHEVVERLAEPLLGGVYAGRAANLSARAAIPQVVSLLREHGSLLAAAAAVPPASDRPVFAGLEGGLGTLPPLLSSGLAVRTDSAVRAVARTATGFRLTLGSARSPETLEADRVVLATPAAPTARLLAEVSPVAARELAAIEYASLAIVTIAVSELDVGGSSGFLVPAVDGRDIKAATYSFSKWGWVDAASDLRILRASVGRHGEEASLQVTDDVLVARALAELARATGQPVAPVDVHVQRWGGALPQYAVGHLDRVARIRAAERAVPGLALCGAAYDGVGIPGVVGSARRAAAAVLAAQ
ncbi:MAG TPA: protoporphyrinogen oxidase [Nocardioides sp.]|uniref:protoporphyrinogen oxidase n=1 Tax=Nocardioides sp. TaxID=35761 RepID=UPI002E2EF73A|nr:protoporphyrinogen oxidase [Nocardioides sp.]HEX3930086.1 protoporphyrinogen oxidase [Nocardioides sp.]